MRGQGGVMWTEDHKRWDVNHIAWINLIQSNTTHCAKFWLMRAQKFTSMPHPLVWPPPASLGAFCSVVWKKRRGGIHESTPQPRGKNTVKLYSERRIPRKSLENWRLFIAANLVVQPAWLKECVVYHTLTKNCMCGTLEFSKIAHWNSEKWVWDNAGGVCNVAVPVSPDWRLAELECTGSP